MEGVGYCSTCTMSAPGGRDSALNRQGLVGDKVGERVTRSKVPGRGSLVGVGSMEKRKWNRTENIRMHCMWYRMFQETLVSKTYVCTT